MKTEYMMNSHRCPENRIYNRICLSLHWISTISVDLVIFARFYFLRISWGGRIREFKNHANIIIRITLRIKKVYSRFLNFVKSSKIRNSRKFKHVKITRSTLLRLLHRVGIVSTCQKYINPCPVELFQIIFHSFKAGIAKAISSFKWRKIFLFKKNKHLPNWNIWSAEHLPLLIDQFQWHFIWVETFLKTYISGSSRTRVNFIYPSKHDKLNQYWSIVGPPSTTLAQHWSTLVRSRVVAGAILPLKILTE